jgi:hypothetical protein
MVLSGFLRICSCEAKKIHGHLVYEGHLAYEAKKLHGQFIVKKSYVC